jgi:hypothetical protein
VRKICILCTSSVGIAIRMRAGLPRSLGSHKPILSSERMSHKDDDGNGSGEKKTLS